MSYHKFSIVGGHVGGEYKNESAGGHVSIGDALVLAKAHGWEGEISMSHHTADLSGRGLGTVDGRWKINAATGEAHKIEGRVDADDSGDVNELWDEVER